MPPGIKQNNNLLHLTLDVWQDQVFMNDVSYPAGHFAAEILNIKEDSLQLLLSKGGEVSHYAERMFFADRAEFSKLLPKVKAVISELLDELWRYPPYSLLDRAVETKTLDTLFCDKALDDLLNFNSQTREFFFRYLTAAFSIPLGIYHFVVAGWFFELDYLRRLNKRNETFFAHAAYDCFNSKTFWEEMQALPMPDIETFTVSPPLHSSYVFARSPKNEKEMVFVSRNRFETIIHFYTFDLMNGLHHGHAPSQCHNCLKYFLTTNGHMPKYCDGIAPQDSRMTCRQYGAMLCQKEQNEQHPIYRLFKTRTNTIRKHHQRGKISDELRRGAIYMAEFYRDKALMDNDYAANGYAQDMEQEHIYAEAQKRLK